MYADRYGSAGIKPGSLSVAIGLNGAILAALIFSTPEFKKTVETVLHTRNIPVVVPPEPEPLPDIKPKTDIKAIDPTPREKLVIPDPIVPRTDPGNDLVGKTTIDPPLPPGSGGAGTIYEPPHVAVLAGAMPDPRYANLFQPTFPGDERRAGNEGRVVVRVLIGTDGRVKQIEKVSAASDSFFEATRRQALGKWRFKPATKDGIPQEAWRTMSVSFVLNEDS